MLCCRSGKRIGPETGRQMLQMMMARYNGGVARGCSGRLEMYRGTETLLEGP